MNDKALHKTSPYDAIGDFIPDTSWVECTHIQGIRAADVVVYLNVLITQKMGALGSLEGWEKWSESRELHFEFLKYLNFSPQPPVITGYCFGLIVFLWNIRDRRVFQSSQCWSASQGLINQVHCTPNGSQHERMYREFFARQNERAWKRVEIGIMSVPSHARFVECVLEDNNRYKRINTVGYVWWRYRGRCGRLFGRGFDPSGVSRV